MACWPISLCSNFHADTFYFLIPQCHQHHQRQLLVISVSYESSASAMSHQNAIVAAVLLPNASSSLVTFFLCPSLNCDKTHSLYFTYISCYNQKKYKCSKCKNIITKQCNELNLSCEVKTLILTALNFNGLLCRKILN